LYQSTLGLRVIKKKKRRWVRGKCVGGGLFSSSERVPAVTPIMVRARPEDILSGKGWGVIDPTPGKSGRFTRGGVTFFSSSERVPAVTATRVPARTRGWCRWRVDPH